MNPVGLYIHIPFCDAKCAYCDFVTFTDRHNQIDSYLRAMEVELNRYRGWPVQTMFIGGGTPTVLSVPQIERLLNAVRTTLDTRPLTEATVEANPESATEERLRAYRSMGINRLSFGVQSTNNALLERLGRLHDRQKFLDRFSLARSLGFDNINIDLMFGLPGQTLDDWNTTMSDAIALAPEHISAYALKVEPGTRFGQEGVVVDGDLEADMYLAASELLTKSGYEHYEISNFCRPGREAKHNMLYWENSDTVGIGVSSTSYVNGRRTRNTAHLSTYMEAVASGASIVAEDSGLEAAATESESVMLALRLKKGVPVDRLARANTAMTATFLERGLAVEEKGMYSLTPKGWLLSNQLFQHFV